MPFAAPAVLVGDDVLFGGAGRNILIGGLGSDALHGNAGEDILIGGTTDFDCSLTALTALRDDWFIYVGTGPNADRLHDVDGGDAYLQL